MEEEENNKNNKKQNIPKNIKIISNPDSDFEEEEEDEDKNSDSPKIPIISHRPKSVGKISHTKVSKEIKNKFILKSNLTLNIKSSFSTPRLQDALSRPKASMSDYDIIKDLGDGSYGKVVLAKSKEDGKQFAIKIIRKDLLNTFDKQYEIHVEKFCLIYLSHPNIIKFNKAFQDKKHLYFVMEYCKNKDLGKLIRKIGTFNFKLAQYYAAEIISAITYMKKRGVYHRDLKPENIGIDEDMHLKILDFATSNMENKYFDKKLMKFVEIEKAEYDKAYNEMKQRKSLKENNDTIDYVIIDGHKILNLKEKFVGTAEYISPEVLENKFDLIGPGVDIWAFGVMLYLFFAGVTPFKGKNDDETLENIKKVNYSWTIIKNHEKIEINIPKEAKDLIQKILIKDPTQRIGYNSKDYSEIKSHPFFKGINFDTLSEEPIPLNKAFSLLESLGYIDNNDIAVEKDDDIYINVLNNSDDKIMDEQHSTGSMDNAELRLTNKKLTFDRFQSFRMSFFPKKENKLNKNENMIIENNDEINNNLIVTMCKSDKHNKTIDNDIILIEDILCKKSPFVYYNKRYCKLFSKGHLDYYHFPTKVFKGSIIINENSKVNPIDDYRFELISQNKIYHFKHISKRITDDWTENINKIILDKIKMSKK